MNLQSLVLTDFLPFFKVQSNSMSPFLLTPSSASTKKVTKHIFLEEYMHLIAFSFFCKTVDKDIKDNEK